MPQSLANIYVHLVFSTKNREPLIRPELRQSLHAYMATVLANLKCPAVLINSMDDHVHILFNLNRTITLADVVEEVKKSSSKWMKSQGSHLTKFAWQAGYGAFSVSESNSPKVANYIREQEAHHRKMTFQDEFRKFLRRHKIEFDERYLWD